MELKIKNKIKENMNRYNSDEFQIYMDEAGWEDWMNEYTEASEGDEISEREIKKIVQIQNELWNEVHLLE